MRIGRLIRMFVLTAAAALMLIMVTSCGDQDSPQPPLPGSRAEETQKSSQSAPTETFLQSAETQREPEYTPKTPSEEPNVPEETGNAGNEQPAESEIPAESETPENTSQEEDAAIPDKVAYLTIDDGPSRKITPAILDLLKEEGIKATFFVLPHSGVDDIYQRIIDEGHEIGNHSYSHVYANLYKSDDLEAFKEDVMAARNYIYEKFGYLTVSYRFPGGAMGRKDNIMQPRKEYLDEIGYRWFDWNLSTGDADKTGMGKSAEILASNVLDNLKERSHAIILMHDTFDKSETLAALPMIITQLRERGYVFDIISNYPQES